MENRCLKSWLVSCPDDPGQGRCLVCPPPKGDTRKGKRFSIREGRTAISHHNLGKRHQELLREKLRNHDDNHNTKSQNEGDNLLKQIEISEALQNQKELTAKVRKTEQQVLNGQILLVNILHVHGVPSRLANCIADCLPSMFPDSKVAKMWSKGKTSMRATKADYFLTHGLYPFQKIELVKILQKSFFSANFDESSVNRTTQMDINISFFHEGRVKKTNFTTIAMTEGSTAREIVDVFFREFETNSIPLQHIVMVSFLVK